MEKKILIDLPMTPNFIMSADGKQKWPIREFTDKELREIGKLWTNNLIRKARAKGVSMED